MFRYIIAHWDPKRTHERAAGLSIRRHLLSSPTWTVTLDSTACIAAYVNLPFGPERAITLPDGAGVVFGCLFEQSCIDAESDPRAVTALSQSDIRQLVVTGGRSAVTKFWGSYVLLLHNAESGTSTAFRGPMSRLPCFMAKIRGVNLLFSDAEDYLALGPEVVSINWPSLAAQVSNGDFANRETGIQEISLLECGESLELKQGECRTRILWQPSEFIESGASLSFDAAATNLRSITQHCVGAWASLHESLLLSLSGGLDSSIVASCLIRTRSPPRVTAVNYYSAGCGDERKYARAVAKSLTLDLLEEERHSEVDLRIFEQCALTVRPVLSFAATDVHFRNNAIARARDATAIFDGELGDNLFGHGIGPEALVEHVRRTGVTPNLMRVARDYAVLKRHSFWATLREAARETRYWRTQRFMSCWRYAERTAGLKHAEAWLVSRDVLDAYRANADDFMHPWLRVAPPWSVGKLELLFGLVTLVSPSYHPPFCGLSWPPMVAPLVSQPLVEMALRIPTYLHLRNGIDRAVARAAFRDALPSVVLDRGAAKGRSDQWIRKVVERNAPFIREFLLDGELVKRGMLDANKLEAVLSERLEKNTIYLIDIFVQLFIEGWLRRWMGIINDGYRRHQAAAVI